jgi:hypothetical protein
LIESRPTSFNTLRCSEPGKNTTKPLGVIQATTDWPARTSITASSQVKDADSEGLFEITKMPPARRRTHVVHWHRLAADLAAASAPSKVAYDLLPYTHL